MNGKVRFELVNTPSGQVIRSTSNNSSLIIDQDTRTGAVTVGRRA